MKSLILAIISLVFVSCGSTYQCPYQSLSPAFIGYATPEVDTIIMQRYKKGTNFSEAIDEILLTGFNAPMTRSGDTTRLYRSTINDTVKDYDFKIINPFDNKVIAVSDMSFQINEERRGRGIFSMDPSPSFCTSPLLSYMRDNVKVSISNPGVENAYLYIKR